MFEGKTAEEIVQALGPWFEPLSCVLSLIVAYIGFSIFKDLLESAAGYLEAPIRHHDDR